MFSDKCPLCNLTLIAKKDDNISYAINHFLCSCHHYYISFIDNLFRSETVYFNKYYIIRSDEGTSFFRPSKNPIHIDFYINIYNLTDSKIDKLLALV